MSMDVSVTLDDWDQLTCACAACCAARGENVSEADIAEQAALAGVYSIDTVTGDADQAIDALLGGVAWATTELTFSFPDSASDFTYNWYGEQAGFGAFNAVQMDAARAALQMYEDVSGLVFTELTGVADRDADLTFAESTSAGTAYAYFPSSGDWGGDSWFNTRSFNAPEAGNYAWSTMMHEIGHALGLKHGHDTSGTGAIPTDFDSHEYSLMTYRSYVGSPGSYYSNETWGGPQTPMMLDIAAIQRLYGANYEFNAGDTTYAFDPETGQMLVDGLGGETPGGNRILRTIWDGGGEDTYDLSNYSTDLAIDLTPGGFTDLDVGGFAQRSRLGYGEYAKGHVFNALLFGGDEASLIENAFGGTGNDVLVGNIGGNILDGGEGDDQLVGGAGDDELIGGEGVDVAIFDGVFSDFSISQIDDVLEVTGEGRDRVFATVETLRFADVDVSFASLIVPETTETPVEVETQTEVPTTPDENATTDAPSAADDTASPPEETSSEEPAVDETDVRIQDESDPPTPPDPLTDSDPVDQPPLVDDPDAGGENNDDPVVDPKPRSLNEELEGGAAAEFMVGGEGADTLSGRGGDDTLSGDAGADLLSGNRGADRLRGGADDDTLKGNGGTDHLRGGGDDDLLEGGAGADTLIGGAGDDTGFGGGGSDKLFGRGGADNLDGGGGADTLRGDGGDDVITGGRGSDLLTGGAGDDLFVFAADFGADEITDFGSGDRLSFSAHSGVDGFGDLTIQSEGRSTIVFDGLGGQVMLTGVNAEDVLESDFLF